MIHWFTAVWFLDLHHFDLMLQQITRIADNYLKNSLGTWKHAPRLALTPIGCHVPEGSQTVPEELSESNGEYGMTTFVTTHCIAHYWLLASDLWAVARWYSAQLVTPCRYHLLVAISFKVSKIQTHTRFHHICFIHGMLACETTVVWITSWPCNILKIGCNDRLTSTTCQVFQSATQIWHRP